MRWLLVAQDGWGLGHVSRQLGLARALKQLRPNDTFLILTLSEATHLIAREGFPSVKLPAPQISTNADQLHLDPALRIWLSGALANTTMATYKPQAVVLDTFPIGLNGEFAAILRANCLRFLISREVINPPPHWEYLESLRHFHALLAPYTEGEIDLPIPKSDRLHFVGPMLIRGRDDLLPRDEARRRLGVPQERRVCLVSFGGGGNAAYSALDEWAGGLAAQYPDWHFAFSAPPLLRQTGELPTTPNASRFAYYPMAECYGAFDAAITTTGSSAYELAFMGVPSILVPSVSPHQIEDHLQKARRILGQDGGFVVPAYDSEALEKAFAVMNDPQRLAAMKQDRAALRLPDGAAAAAQLLVNYTAKIHGDAA